MLDCQLFVGEANTIQKALSEWLREFPAGYDINKIKITATPNGIDSRFTTVVVIFEPWE